MTGVNITRITMFRYSLNWLDDKCQIVEGNKRFYSEHYQIPWNIYKDSYIYITDHCHRTVKFREMIKNVERKVCDVSSIESEIEQVHSEVGALLYPSPQVRDLKN